MVIKNVCLSRRRKADLVSFRSDIQTLATLIQLVAQKPDRTLAVQSINNLSRIETGLQNAIMTKPYVKMGRMSNQQKVEFIGDIFRIRSFWGGGGYGKISTKTYFI
jgi:hypothetical protein